MTRALDLVERSSKEVERERSSNMYLPYFIWTRSQTAVNQLGSFPMYADQPEDYTLPFNSLYIKISRDADILHDLILKKVHEIKPRDICIEFEGQARWYSMTFPSRLHLHYRKTSTNDDTAPATNSS